MISSWVKRTLVVIQLWVWAATKHSDFKKFELAIVPPISLAISYWKNGGTEVHVRIQLSKPDIYYFIPWTAVDEFAKVTQADVSFLEEEDNIPF